MNLSRKILVLLTFSCFMLMISVVMAAEQASLVGRWSGTLKAGIQEFPIVFNITGVDDQLKVTFDSPAQGAKDIPVSSVRLENTTVTFEITAAQATYVATLTSNTEQMNGFWRQGPNELPLLLDKVEAVASSASIDRPQEPQKPYGYTEELVEFSNHKANIQLAGTLTLPKEGSNVPAVVMITGSGPQDRDQTFMGHKTFWVLADYLTKQGFAVLRFDDRGIGKSEGNFAEATSLDFAHDVSAAVNFLSKHNRINKEVIGLIGHSEGGLIAPITASLNSNVSFIVSLAGPGLTGNEIAVTQVRDVLLSIGLDKGAANAGSQITQQLNQTVLENHDKINLPQELRSTYQRAWHAIPQTAKGKLSAIGGGQLSEARVEELSSNWTKYFLQHDPKSYLSQLTIPTLVLYGSKDTQLDPNTNLPVFEEVLTPKNALNQIEVIEGLNHLFQPAETGLMNEYVSIKVTFSPIAMAKIATWIKHVSD